MEFFIDTTITNEVREVPAWGGRAGLGVHPSLIGLSDVVREPAGQTGQGGAQ
ncbi:hypothetical protein [Deinococcus aerophilus]|uniref:Uncharacterized protein n=1 Tax=Deinococcus aerophilus TaxID=522488 RepID=A0ABQ2GPN6_9DEIO|nr:hypothetical protein [Deinococcus aerophilus]GGM07040.1 hypothetical protein GCM10010841_14040 [Deinococcus aerophilus]